MSVVSVRAQNFILALFIRDDGERFLLGDNGYDFIDSQLHFVGNSIENDEVAKQGTDGVMLAGQVRRSAVQTFDGYVGDATTPKEEIEQMRRAFIAFFLKDHHYRVVYVDCARNAWQRKGGYLVDAPEVKELFQVHPEYHVGLNFEDVNYYSYDENAEGDEITANLVQVAISSAVEGGLVWDEDGAVSEDATVVYDGDTATASGKSISIADAVNAPLASFQLDGETSQNGTPAPDAPVPVQTVTGENVVKITDGQGAEQSFSIDLGSIELCKIGTYQDYIYKSGDKWYKHAEIGKTDLANYNYTVASAVLRRTTAIPNMKYVSANTEVGSAIAEKYIIHEGRGMSSANLAGYMAVDVSMFAVNVGTSDTSVNPTGLLYYALATPTDTEITNATLVGQLEAILAGGTFAGTNNIALIPSGNEQGSLEITYYTKYIVNITAGGYEWEQGGSGGPTIVMNESIDNVYPIWTITGPITNPVLENTTTGEQIEYVGTIGEGQKLIIDMGAQTALLDGLNVLSNVVGEFISLAPGANTLLYSVSNGDTASEIGWSEIVG